MTSVPRKQVLKVFRINYQEALKKMNVKMKTPVNKIAFMCSFAILAFIAFYGRATERKPVQAPLSVGYSTPLKSVTEENMKYAKSSGVTCIETSLAEFIDKTNRTFLLSDQEIIRKVKAAKAAADKAGIKIWSVHMPFSPQIDLSLADEAGRKEVVALHLKMLEFCAILKPRIILFHPSYFLGRNERELRKSQLIKSANELNPAIRKIRCTMVVENMLGKEVVVKGGLREWPLCRDVAETRDVMSKLPESIGSAIDFNHIKNPQELILAMGRRLKTVHVADGDGLKECHYFPCSGEGQNDWNAILSVLDKVGYKGPFLYECKIPDVKDLKPCYENLYRSYKQQQTNGGE